MSAVTVHEALTVGPGVVLAALVITPGAARIVFGDLFGFVPAFLLELLSGSNEGLLTGAAESFSTIGQAIQGVGLGQLQIVDGSALLISGVLVSMLLYRNAVHRFERYTPP